MAISFPFEKGENPFLGTIHRPVADVYIKHLDKATWRKTKMLVDTGADYTLLPRYLAILLGVNLQHDCKEIKGQGVGGESKIYFFKGKIAVKIGGFNRDIPLGFVSNNYIPPILGRHEFFETFKVIFEKFNTRFE